MAVVLFPEFELMDVAAPGEILGAAPTVTRLLYASERAGPVPSSCMQRSGGTVGPALVATHVLREGGVLADALSGEAVRPDALLVPGGKGMREEVHNRFMLDWLRDASGAADVVFTVCTGSWLLGATGVLDGVRVTSNKSALRDGHPQKAAPRALWQLQARWVEHEVVREDGRKTLFVSSSGVSAGGDAALALLARRASMDLARRIAHAAEWSWHDDATVDPFANAYFEGSDTGTSKL